tara:strand:+ start:70 stop:279 length:210 start_codon:yes stop_codon:yes gene_type:complete
MFLDWWMICIMGVWWLLSISYLSNKAAGEATTKGITIGVVHTLKVLDDLEEKELSAKVFSLLKKKFSIK